MCWVNLSKSPETLSTKTGAVASVAVKHVFFVWLEDSTKDWAFKKTRNFVSHSFGSQEVQDGGVSMQGDLLSASKIGFWVFLFDLFCFFEFWVP